MTSVQYDAVQDIESDAEPDEDSEEALGHIGLGIPPAPKPLPDVFQPHWTQR